MYPWWAACFEQKVYRQKLFLQIHRFTNLFSCFVHRINESIFREICRSFYMDLACCRNDLYFYILYIPQSFFSLYTYRQLYRSINSSHLTTQNGIILFRPTQIFRSIIQCTHEVMQRIANHSELGLCLLSSAYEFNYRFIGHNNFNKLYWNKDEDTINRRLHFTIQITLILKRPCSL